MGLCPLNRCHLEKNKKQKAFDDVNFFLFLLLTPFGGWYIGGYCPRLKDCPKDEHLAERRSFEGNCEILRTIFQPRVLSSDIYQQAEKGFISFITLRIIFQGERTVDHSCIFCGFFLVSRTELSISFLFIYHWLLQKVFFGFP